METSFERSNAREKWSLKSGDLSKEASSYEQLSRYKNWIRSSLLLLVKPDFVILEIILEDFQFFSIS